ncbi:SGNH/GDSL hydrolase family protein [Flavobacterium aciduliphilum]|uniref:Lysophospholipase L1-like esterase n=1 Tax=Flavobacterium aciduliphilum TaxID=1101402 RepID=A0A328YNN9_9FLAO|nr:hypothetical protein [Flavobacterium aciduliphilum]RAR71696.1 lysophospholipase L1-like esterase [Flavobacterium aciduliphilum]
MNHNKNNSKKVIALILVVTIIQLTLSVYSDLFSAYYPYFKNVDLLSDILVIPKNKKTRTHKISHKEISVPTTFNDFFAYEKKGTLIRFNQDTIYPALQKINEKLLALAYGKNVKIRIAWFGDSQIEGDFITQDVREMLQNYFGAPKGVGYVPLTSIASDFRRTAKVSTTGFVTADNFKKNTHQAPLFLSGYSFYGNTIDVSFWDNVRKDPQQATQKWLLYGKGDTIAIKINDTTKKFPATHEFNRALLTNNPSRRVSFSVTSQKTPIFGLSSEPQSGIVLDNFSFRGITGVELKKLNQNLLKEINKSGYYDLVVFQYGVNLMFKPDDTNYDYYYRGMKPVLKKFKTLMPNTEIVLFSCSDRAFNYDGTWKTAVGIDSLIQTQARLAYDMDVPFYNFYKSMGGKGTIVKWADSTVQLANKDYIHFNYRGAKVVAKIIFDALIKDYSKALNLYKQNRSFIPTPNKKPSQDIPIKKNSQETISRKIDSPKVVKSKESSSKDEVEKPIIVKSKIEKSPEKKTDSI